MAKATPHAVERRGLAACRQTARHGSRDAQNEQQRPGDGHGGRQCGAVSAVLLTKAIRVLSGDHEGTFIVPWPP